MSTTHTPGPWREHSHRQIGPDAGIVCEVWSAIGETDADRIAQADANARLIAAAPDLLEALQEMVAGDAEAIEDAKRLGVPFPDEMLAAYHKARAAIAKATGEQP